MTWHIIPPNGSTKAKDIKISNGKDLETSINEINKEMSSPTSVQVQVVDGVLTLTKDRYQRVDNMEDGTEIILPVDAEVGTEITVKFDALEDLSLILPVAKWHDRPIIITGNSYEFMFKKYDTCWFAGCVEYE